VARGFTLVEILVSMGIIVLLVALLVPFLSRAFRKGGEYRTQADLNSIAMALEAYRQDFGDIPRTSGPNSGAATLCKALIGPYGGSALLPPYDGTKSYKAGECVSVGSEQYLALQNSTGAATTDPLFWAKFDPRDGADGPGFKVRTGAALSGPYMDPAKTKVQGSFILDSLGRPILYFPARPGRITVTQSAPLPMYVDRYYNGAPPNPAALFNADDNFEAYRHGEGTADDKKVLSRIRLMFRDYHPNGYIETDAATPDNNELPISQPYVLVAAGPDGLFGPAGYTPPDTLDSATATENRKAVNSCDDVMNLQK
jgi:prepilin-type N-terminal cleavage/methylation domain-containing protein